MKVPGIYLSGRRRHPLRTALPYSRRARRAMRQHGITMGAAPRARALHAGNQQWHYE